MNAVHTSYTNGNATQALAFGLAVALSRLTGIVDSFVVTLQPHNYDGDIVLGRFATEAEAQAFADRLNLVAGIVTYEADGYRYVGDFARAGELHKYIDDDDFASDF